jgi:hypothetical protein
LVYILNYVSDVFDADGKPYEVIAESRRGALFGVQLLVRSASRMYDERFCVADVSEVTQKLRAFDERDGGIIPTLDAEANKSTGAFG